MTVLSFLCNICLDQCHKLFTWCHLVWMELTGLIHTALPFYSKYVMVHAQMLLRVFVRTPSGFLCTSFKMERSLIYERQGLFWASFFVWSVPTFPWNHRISMVERNMLSRKLYYGHIIFPVICCSRCDLPHGHPI